MQDSAILRDGRIAMAREGDRGPLVVCVHGTPTFSFEWRHVLQAFGHTHRLVAPDHLGFGYSDRPADGDYSPEAHARRFSELMAQIAPHEPLTLVVHDFGGPIALDWALAHPERLTRVVIVNSWMWSLADDALMRRRAALASGALGRWMYRRLNASLRLIMPSAYGDRSTLTATIHRTYRDRFPDADSRERVLFALARALLGSSAFFEQLWARRVALRSVPLHLLWGMRDSAFPPTILTRWIDAFPHASVHRFDRSGHWPHEEEPEAFCAALRGVLAMDAVNGSTPPTE